jgi:hypothetical protein
MKLFVTISFIASVISIINGNNIPKPANHNQDMESIFTDSLVTNTKQCYKCDFAIDNFIDTNTLLNDKCTNKTINCDNAFCSTILSKNKHYSKYTMQLGCISKNYCPKITEKNTQYPEVITDNYINCCDDNLCNDGTTINNVLPFYLEKNNKYFINDIAPKNQTINYKDVVSNILHDFSFADDYLDKSCIHKLFFTNQDNLIITLKKNDCNNNLIGVMPEDSFPAFPSQPIEKIIFLDKNNKTVTDLISSDTGITSINYISEKNLLFFIANDTVFVYKLDTNKQLRKISQLYLNNNPIDIAINYNAKVIAVTNKDTVYFYNIENIEQNKQFIAIEKQISKQVGESNIYKLQYTPNRDTILVKSYDANYVYTDLYNLENFNKITDSIKTEKHNRYKRHSSIENIKYNPYKLDFYYGKSAISPIDNLMLNKVACNISMEQGANYRRTECFRSDVWGFKNSRDNFSTEILTEDMLQMRQYAQYSYKDISTIYFHNVITHILNYFFTTDNKPVMAFITLKEKGERYLFVRQVPGFEQVSNDYDNWKQYLKENSKLITFKKIFDSARSGLFNKNSSKIAIFGHNRIQIHTVNLDQYKRLKITTTKTSKTASTDIETKTTKLPEIKTTKLPEIKTTKLPETKATKLPETKITEEERKTTRLKFLFPSLANKINLTNLNNDKKLHNDFLDEFNNFIKENPYKITAAAAATALFTSIVIISCIIKHKKSNKKSKQKTIDDKKNFLSIDLETPLSYQNKAMSIDSQEINEQNKATVIDSQEINKQNKATDIDSQEINEQNKATDINSQEINEQNKTTDIDSQEINKQNKATVIDIKDNAINKQENQYIDFNYSNMQEIRLGTDN